MTTRTIQRRVLVLFLLSVGAPAPASERCPELTAHSWTAALGTTELQFLLHEPSRSVVAFGTESTGPIRVLDRSSGRSTLTVSPQEILRASERTGECAGGVCVQRTPSGTWYLTMLERPTGSPHVRNALVYRVRADRGLELLGTVETNGDGRVETLQELPDGRLLVHTRLATPIGNASVPSAAPYRTAILDPLRREEPVALPNDLEHALVTTDGRVAALSFSLPDDTRLSFYDGRSPAPVARYRLLGYHWYGRPLRFVQLSPRAFLAVSHDGGLSRIELPAAPSSDGGLVEIRPQRFPGHRDLPALGRLERVSDTEALIFGRAAWWTVDAVTGRVTASERPHARVTSVVVSADRAKLLGATEDGRLVLWDRATGRLAAVKNMNGDRIESMYVAGTADGSVYLTAAATGETRAYGPGIWTELSSDTDLPPSVLYRRTVTSVRGGAESAASLQRAWAGQPPRRERAAIRPGAPESSIEPLHQENVFGAARLTDGAVALLRSVGFAMPFTSSSPPAYLFFKQYLELVRSDGTTATLTPVDGLSFENIRLAPSGTELLIDVVTIASERAPRGAPARRTLRLSRDGNPVD